MKRSVTRRLDDLGRIVIPSDFREELGMEPGEKGRDLHRGRKSDLKKNSKSRPSI